MSAFQLLVRDLECFATSTDDYTFCRAELIELDLFNNGLARFSTADFEAAGLNADDRFIIEHMAVQEIGHAILIVSAFPPLPPTEDDSKF